MKNHFFISVLIFSLLSLTSFSNSQDNFYYVCIADKLNIRESPSTSSKVLCTLNYGDYLPSPKNEVNDVVRDIKVANGYEWRSLRLPDDTIGYAVNKYLLSSELFNCINEPTMMVKKGDIDGAKKMFEKAKDESDLIWDVYEKNGIFAVLCEEYKESSWACDRVIYIVKDDGFTGNFSTYNLDDIIILPDGRWFGEIGGASQSSWVDFRNPHTGELLTGDYLAVELEMRGSIDISSGTYAFNDKGDLFFYLTGCGGWDDGPREIFTGALDIIALAPKIYSLDMNSGKEALIFEYIDNKWVPTDEYQNNITKYESIMKTDVAPIVGLK